jgi:O-antigen ligase/tetratricopeptide (TPR) repeat protein
MYVSSALGGNFRFSFWSNIERSEGLLFWTHLYVLYVIIRNVCNTKKEWGIVFDFFLGTALCVAVVGLLQSWNVSFINASSGGDRIASTIGNAAFLGGYMLFAVGMSLYMYTQRSSRFARIYYLITSLLYVFILLKSGTRGAYLGLAGAFLLAGIYAVIRKGSQKLRFITLGVLIAVIVASVALYTARDQAWVSNNYILRRATGISISDYTAQTRLWTWQSALKGFQERPLLGYGQENFYIAFNKYFNPKIFRDSGSQIWFDRAHNIYLDHLLIGGILGLLLYLSIIIYPVFMLIRSNRRSDNALSASNERTGNLLLILGIVGFLIQGFVVFESLPVYLGLLLTLGLIADRSKAKVFYVPLPATTLCAIVWVIGFLPAQYYFNVREYQANTTVIQAVRLQATDPMQAYDLFKKAIDYRSGGTQEYRLRLSEFVVALLVNKQLTPDLVKQYIEYSDEELRKRIADNPSDAAGYLIALRQYNSTYIIDQSRLDKVDDLAAKGIALSPTRPQFYSELGYAQYYRAKILREEGKEQETGPFIASMKENFDKAIALNDTVAESYINILMVLLASKQTDAVQKYFDAMDAKGLPYKTQSVLDRLANSAIAGKDFEWAVKLYTQLTEVQPQNAQYWVSLALSYATIDKKQEAIAAAEHVRSLGGIYAEKSEEFIKSVRNGTFKKDL